MSRGAIEVGSIDDAFFRGKALLLVEDVLTRKLLTTCWTGDPVGMHITVQPAGGRGGVEALLQAAREERRNNVFGLIDRDFGLEHSQVLTAGQWRSTPGHEIENALLDFPVLASLCARSLEDVASTAHGIAEKLIPWMALRRIVHQVKNALPGTPEDPKPSIVNSEEAAFRWLKEKNYPGSLEKVIHVKWTAKDVQKLLRAELVRTRQTWEREAWVEEFSGKEIVAQLRSPATGLAWLPDVAASDKALALAVAQRWRLRRKIPGWITRLRDDIQQACLSSTSATS